MPADTYLSKKSTSSLTEEGFAHHQAGRLKEAEILYRQVLDEDPNNYQALHLLGTLSLRTGRSAEALTHLEKALTHLKKRGPLTAPHAVLYSNIGNAMRLLGRNKDAMAHFKKGLALNPELTELHISLGASLMQQDDFTAAILSYEAALALNPNLPECLCDLGTAYARSGRFEDAIIFYRKVLATMPLHKVARINLAQMLRRTEKYDDAIHLLKKLLKETPGDHRIHNQLGIAYVAVGQYDLSLHHFKVVLQIVPDDAQALQYIANIQQLRGNEKEANQNYLKSFQLKPLITIPAIKSPPDFKVLLLFAPGAGNTPLDLFMDRTDYENNILNLLPGTELDIELLRKSADVVVNLIADVDQGETKLAPAKELLELIGKPILNHPDKIKLTDRQSISTLLSNIPNCFTPKTERFKGRDLAVDDFKPDPKFFSYPFLVRRTGTHGGIDFEKIGDGAELKAFVTQNIEADYYLTEYIDYSSKDGFFRKYRFIYVNDEVYPYHLAIDNKWKIHHVTTDMLNQTWMQMEEKAYLLDPHNFFGDAQYAALNAIRKKVDLDFFGIDCGLGKDGRIIVFEVNACMLVHQHNEKFPYKAEPVKRIKKAFDTMLRRIALPNTEAKSC